MHAASTAAGFAPDWWLPGLTEHERAATGGSHRPGWASFVERACADAGDPGTCDPDATGVDTLAPAVSPLVAAAAELAGQPAGLADQLRGQLCQLAARTLVLELNVARAAGRLTGATPGDRFAEFVRSTGTGTGFALLCTAYPVLARVLGVRCLQAVRARRELLDRFAADRAAVVAELFGGVDPGPLVAVDCGGDRHRGGRTVDVLRFARDARVVYKPRPLALHRHFTDLVDWLNDAVPWLGLRTIRCVERDGYGWQEFVQHLPCPDTAAVERFYLRQGALLALLYALDGTDVHHENVVACGDQPVVVDTETLFHPTLAPETALGPDPALAMLMSSVHRTALLPTMIVGEHGALDVSGVGGDDRDYPVDAVCWADSGTDAMRLVRGRKRFTGSRNRPGADVVPEDHRGAMVIGFRAAYDAVVRSGDTLAALVGRCADDEIRVVARPTQVYATLLAESTHPDCMRDARERDRLFESLGCAPEGFLRRLAPYEVRDLWAGDVPMFVSRPASRDVATSAGVVLPDVLDSTGLAAVGAKWARMGAVDRCDQEWLIEATLASRVWNDHAGGRTLPGSLAPSVPDAERLLCAACTIADDIVVRAVHDAERVNWLTVEPIDGRQWTVLPMGAGLGSGYTGVALFLAQLGALTGMARYTDLAWKAIRPLPRLLRTLAGCPDVVGCGAFLGIGGICYALARLAALLGDPVLTEWLAAALPLMAAADDGQSGLAAGRAGGLAAMLAVAEQTGSTEARALASVLAGRLVADDSVGGQGFLAGRAGAGWALSRYAAAGGGTRCAERGRALVAADWRDAGTEPGWCTGLSGLLLAGAGYEIVEQRVPSLAERPALCDLSLCHGELGVLESLVVRASRGDAECAAMVRQGSGVVLGGLDRFGPRCGTPRGVSCPGLLTGLAGIGYGLLRLGMPDAVPSVLLLEPGSTERKDRHDN